MTSMQVFLEKLQSHDIQQLYARNTTMWTERMALLNTRLQQADLPVQVAGMESVWSILYSVAGRYNWMLQFYMRDQGIALSWVGSGRMIFSMNMVDADFDIFVERFVKAALQMQQDGWFWVQAEQTNRQVRQSIFKEMLSKKWSSA